MLRQYVLMFWLSFTDACGVGISYEFANCVCVMFAWTRVCRKTAHNLSML